MFEKLKCALGKHEFEVYKREMKHCTLCAIELKEDNYHPIEYVRCKHCGYETYWWDISVTVNTMNASLGKLPNIEKKSGC